MSIRHPLAEEFEARLKRVFDRIDCDLEKKYGDRLPLHPARLPQGVTANPEQDGLFDIGASFSPGFGTGTGRSYVVDVNLVTLARVPQSLYEEVLSAVQEKLQRGLQEEFPERKLKIIRRGRRLFITGDLQLKE
ncbi:MAG TPA: hypothetical protein EYP62_01985 [Kiritimatiellae bacterium]|nr:hypothetical protein [Kiritimatiellia bacterium]